MIHLLFRIQNFGRSLRGQGGPIRGSEVLNTTHSHGSRPPTRKPKKSATARHPTTNHLALQKAYGPSINYQQESCHQTQANDKKRTATRCKRQRICTPRAVTTKQNYLQKSLSQRTQFWVQKTFSKLASLKGPP